MPENFFWQNRIKLNLSINPNSKFQGKKVTGNYYFRCFGNDGLGILDLEFETWNFESFKNKSESI